MLRLLIALWALVLFAPLFVLCPPLLAAAPFVPAALRRLRERRRRQRAYTLL